MKIFLAVRRLKLSNASCASRASLRSAPQRNGASQTIRKTSQLNEKKLKSKHLRNTLNMNPKKVGLIAVILVIVLSVIVGYFALSYYGKYTDDIHLSLGSSYPTQIQRGSQVEVYIYTTFDARDQITLRTTGELASRCLLSLNILTMD